MVGATPAFVHWLAVGFTETLAMIWLTWWPLVLGFGLSGRVVARALVQEERAGCDRSHLWDDRRHLVARGDART